MKNPHRKPFAVLPTIPEHSAYMAYELARQDAIKTVESVNNPFHPSFHFEYSVAEGLRKDIIAALKSEG